MQVTALASPPGVIRAPDLRPPRWFDPQTSIVALFAVVLVASVLSGAPTTLHNQLAQGSTSELVGPGEEPEGLTAAEWADIQSQIATIDNAEVAVDSRFETLPSSAGLDISFGVEGARVAAVGATHHEVALSTTSAGDERLDPPLIERIGDRVEYRYDGVTEWYRTTTDGFEHGYTVDRPQSAGTDLVVTVAVDGGVPGLLDPSTVAIDGPDDSVLFYRDLYAYDARGVDLPAVMGVDGRDITLTVDTTGAAYPVTIDPIITESQTTLPDEDAAGDLLGEAVAVDADAPGGAVAVVGAVHDDDEGPDFGTVYVFRDSGAGWGQEATIYSPDGADESFGWSVDVVGNMIVVGAPGADANDPDAGAVYVYTFSGIAWGLAETLYECDLGSEEVCNSGGPYTGAFDGHGFGSAVALNESADLLLIGAPDGGTAANIGGVAYLYEVGAGANWESDTVIESPAPTLDNDFGFGLDITGTTSAAEIVIGAPLYDNSSIPLGLVVDSGAAWWYDWNGTAVGASPDELIDSPTLLVTSGNYGGAVTIGLDADSDMVAAVGRPIITRVEESGTGGGGFNIYRVADGVTPAGITRSGVLGLGAPGSESYGRSLAFDGETFLAGWPLNDTGATDRGTVHVVQWVAASDTAVSLTLFGTGDSGDFFGSAVAVDGQRIVAGAPGADAPFGPRSGADAGRTSFWELADLTSPLSTATAQVSNTGDEFGRTVAVDGDRMAVGAWNDDEGDTAAGVVYMFERTGPTAPWTLDDIIVSPSPEPFGHFGDSLALRGDRVAIGESDRFGDAAEPGRVHVFERTGPGEWVQVGSTITSGLAAPDAFGAAIAFVSSTFIVIGAPEAGGTGAVFQTFWTGSEWFAPFALPSTGVAAGDQLGFDVALYEIDEFENIVIAGAPGDDDAGTDAGAAWFWSVGKGTFGPDIVADDLFFSSGDRIGTAVAADSGVFAAAGVGSGLSGDTVGAHLIEDTGSFYEVVDSVTDTLAADVTLPTNGYLDVVGHNLFLGRPGGGGQVDIYRDLDGSGIGTTPVDQFIPSSALIGDDVGFAVGADGRTLVAGAPGDDDQAGLPVGNSGAAYTQTDVALTHTWTGDVDSDWNTPDNWDTGLVPDADDTAIIPPSALTVETAIPAETGVLVLGAGSTMDIIPFSGALSIGPGAPSTIDGDLNNFSVSTLDIASDLLLDGTIDNQETANLIAEGNDITIAGTGTWTQSGTLNKDGTGNATFDSGITWVSHPLSAINIDVGTLDMDVASYLEEGRISVGPGAIGRFSGDLTLAATAIVEIGIAGPSDDQANYGFLDAMSVPSFGAGTLRADLQEYDPVATDSYNVISCGTCEEFGTYDIDVLDVSVGPTDIVLFVDAPELTFDLDRTSPGVVTVAPNGLAVTAFNAPILEAKADDASTVAASPLSAIDVDDSPLSAITIGDTPLSAIVLGSTPLSAIPLIEIDIDGGWDQILAGTDLENVPINDLTFGDALSDPTVAAAVQAAPLSAIDVDDTSVGFAPLSAIALGAIPLSAIPLSAIGEDWCAIVTPYLTGVTCTTEADLTDLNLLEATLQGVPLSAIPLSAIPLSAIDFDDPTVQASPLSAIAVSDAAFRASPLSAIPLSAIPLSAIGPAGSSLADAPLSAIGPDAIPLSAIPLSAIDVAGTLLSDTPLSAIGVAGAPLSAIPTSIPLSAIPLSAIDPTGAPLSAIQKQAAPLSAIPLSAIVLADSPLSAIAGVNWCDVLANADVGFDCTSGADPNTTTLRELSVRGVPLSAIPLSAIDLGILDLTGTPLSAIPVDVVPLSAIPLSAIDLGILDLSGTPLSAINLNTIPLSAIDVVGSPLSAIRLDALSPGALPLSAIFLSDIPLSAIPLSAIGPTAVQVGGTPVLDTPLSAIDVAGSPLSAIALKDLPLSAIGVDCSQVNCDEGTLGEAVAAGAIDATTTLGDIQTHLGGVRLGELAPFLQGVTIGDLIAALETEGLTLNDLTGLDDLTLGDLPQTLTALESVLLSDLQSALFSVRIGDLIGALLDPTTGEPFLDADAEQALRMAVDALALSLSDLDSLGDVTLGDLVADGTTLTLQDIEPVLGFITVQAILDYLGATGGASAEVLGDLTTDELGQLTLADLFDENITEFDTLLLGELLAGITAQLEGFTLGDLLLMLLDPGSLNFGGFDFEAVDVASLPQETVPPVSFAATFAASGSEAGYPIEVEIALPGTASYVPGSGEVTITGAGPPTTTALEPVIGENSLTWTLTSVGPGDTYEITFDVRPTLTLGATALNATARIIGTDVSMSSVASVQVAEGLENNDFPPPNVTPLQPDTVYLTYISSATDIDVFEVTLQDNDVLALELSNLAADFDMALYVDPADIAVGAALSGTSDDAPVIPITDPDQTGVDAQPLDDFVRLDEIDPNLQLLEVSNAPGLENELIVTDRLPAGTYYVQIFGANGATSPTPVVLQGRIEAAEIRPDCQPVGALPAASPGTAPSLTGSANTLLLVNEMRLEQFHGAAGRAAVTTELAELVAYLQANPQLGVDPLVVPVDGFASIRQAYDAWDDPITADDACNPDVANAIVSEINTTIIDPLRDQLDFIVFVGGDEQIPMARLQDETSVANEYDYRHEFDGDITGADADAANAFTSVFWERRFLSDEPYGESAAQSLGSRFLYVSDIALGRLVETPDDIAGALDDFVTHQGSLDTSTGSVLGYDFLADGSAQISADLAASGIPVSDDLADGVDDGTGVAPTGPWERDDAEAALAAAGTNALVSLNAHFDHYRALPAAGDKVPGFDDNLIAATIEGQLAPAGLAQTVVFSMGCHSGLATPDSQISLTNHDWAQAIAGTGGVFIGNTGFGYGDTEAVAYTEQLMALFARHASSPVLVNGVPATIGEALTFAKNQYAAELAVLSVYDEKALMESTFFGLPFYRTALPTAAAPPVPVNVPVPDSGGDLSVRFMFDPENDENVTPTGTYFSNSDANGNEQTIVSPGRPIQPSDSADASVVEPTDSTSLDQIAHGAIVLDMTSTYQEVDDPVVATPVFDESGEQPEPALGEVTFPAAPVTLRTFTGPGGERQSVVVATGQYRSSNMLQRLDDDLDVAVYYAATTETDSTPPAIGPIVTSLDSGLLTVSLTASDVSGVDRAYMLIAENPGIGANVDWVGLDLANTGGDNWSGSIQLDVGTDDVEIFAQVKDTVGNVAYATNKARNFAEDGSETPPPPTPDLTVDVTNDNLAPNGSGWYTGPVTVLVDSGGFSAVYSIDNGSPQPVVGGTFVITGNGIRNWQVTLTENGQTQSGQVRIDTTGAPTISFGTPAADGLGIYVAGTSAFDVACSDPSLVSCELTLTGGGGPPSVVENDSPLPVTPGDYMLAVVATDALDNVASPSPVPFSVVAPVEILPGAHSVVEGDDGSSVVVNVPVTLSGPSATPVTVSWSTVDTGDPAIASGGADHVAASGVVTFEPGETMQTVPITVLGDNIDEPALYGGEWGLIAFSNPSTNATLDTSVFFGFGLFVIFDDDPRPVISPGAAAVGEGAGGSSVVVDVPVTLSNPSAIPVTVEWATLDTGAAGIATADVDYDAASGTVTFAPGETLQTVPITVLGDEIDEPPLLFGEWGLIQFADPSNSATLDDVFFGLGVFVIVDDD